MKYKAILRFFIAIAAAVVFIQLPSYAKTYYVDNETGSDSNSGILPNAAWSSIQRVNKEKLLPGDEVLFRCGRSFIGCLKPSGDGEYGNSVRISSYGDGEYPEIDGAGADSAVKLVDLSYYTVEKLKIKNKNTAAANRSGVLIIADKKDCYDININNLEVTEVDGNCSNFHNAGIYMISNNGRFNGMNIENNNIHDLKTIGIYLIDYQKNRNVFNTAVVIRNNDIVRNGRDGIIVTQAENPLIEKNRLLYIGASGENLNWIAGIFPTRCKNGTIQYNEVGYIVPTADSYALDLDLGCEGVFYYQYNYSHDNAGGFYMQPGGSLSKDTDRAVVRYNISLNEKGSIRIQNSHVDVYNNVLYDNNNAVEIATAYKGGIKDVNIYNNIIYSPGIPEFWYEFSFYNNLYYGFDKFYTGATPVIDPTTGERGDYIEFDISELSKKHKNVIIGNPCFASENVASPEDCIIKDISPAVGGGADVFDMAKDYFGNSVYETYPDVGVCSTSKAVVTTANGNTVTRKKAVCSDTTVKKEMTFYAAECENGTGTTSIGNVLTSCDSGDTALYRNIDFGLGFFNMYIKYSCDEKYAGKNVKIRADGMKGDVIGEFRIDSTGGGENFVMKRIPLKTLRGIHDIYLIFDETVRYGDTNVCIQSYNIGNFEEIILN